MRRYKKWVLALGILAVTPGITMAGLPSFLKFNKARNPAAAKRQTGKKTSNQQVAEAIAASLRSAKLSGFDVGIEFKNGVATLTGTIANEQQKANATQAAARVRGVRHVNNKLTTDQNPVAAKKQTPSEKRQTSGEPITKHAVESPIQAVAFEPTPSTQESPVQLADFASSPSQTAMVEHAEFTDQADTTTVAQTGFQAPAAQPPTAAAPMSAVSSQEMAERIAAALRQARLTGYDIEIRYKNGIATLAGSMATPQQMARATQVVAHVAGVRIVDNRLTLAGQQRAIPPQALALQAARPQQAGRPQIPFPVLPVGYQAAAPQAGPNGPVPPMPAAMAGAPGMPGPPSYGHPGRGTSHVVYNMPHLPEHAWPSYASYPNYAQATYPKEYSASAWPYIGPYYPYPQIPLGWRQAQLEWDDGHWSLNFNPRTDKWFWFLDPKNW